jgi:hypothetical protein
MHLASASSRLKCSVRRSEGTLFAHGTYIPIIGQIAPFLAWLFGCKLLNKRSLSGMREGRLRAIFKGE